jgi:uncharacterized coiled-coil protein SlyX
MFALKENVLTLVIVALTTAIFILVLLGNSILDSKESIIKGLNQEIAEKQVEISRLSFSNKHLTLVIEDTNRKVEALEVDYNKALDTYNRHLKKPPVVRYEVIYKYADKNITKSEECTDVKNILNSLSAVNYDSL